MKNKIIVITIILTLISIIYSSVALASNIIEDEDNEEKIKEINVQDEIDSFVYEFSTQGLNKTILSETIEKYKEFSKEYNNDEIANMLENSIETFGKENINSDAIENIIKLLKNFETKDLNNVIDTINLDKALSELKEGGTVLDLIKSASGNMSTKQKAGLFASLILMSKIFKIAAISIGIIIIYKLIIRCVIYKKAHKNVWAVFIPIYRDIVMLKVCGMSPLWLLFIFVPVLGWFVLWLVHVASRFMLAERFGRSELFGLGLWILWPIFETVLVFSNRIQYIEDDE